MAKKTTATSILQQIVTDLRYFLSQHQQLIFNERKLQLRIAQFLMNTGCYSNVYPEYNGITWRDKNWRNNFVITHILLFKYENIPQSIIRFGNIPHRHRFLRV